MKIHLYNNIGEEFSYDFKPDISFSSHIKNLYENLVLHSEQIKKLITNQWGGDVDISSHYSIQESQSAQWIENSNDPLINQDNTLYFKLKPLNIYIQTVEKYLNLVTGGNSSSLTDPKNQIENQIHNQINQPQSIQLLNNAIDRLHVHITLLMYEDKNNLYFSSSIIKRIINIVFLSPSINSLNLLVFFLSHSNNNNQNNVNEYNNTPSAPLNSTGANHKKSDSVLPIPQPKSPRTNTITNKPKLSESTSSSYFINNNNNNGTNSNEPISLFTLVETSIKELSKDNTKNFYLHLLEDRNIPTTTYSNNTSNNNNNSNSNKFEIICQVFKVINNMYRLSPNPVVYTTKLHQEGVFKRIIEIRESDSKISQNPQYIVLRSNLMKELHNQRLQQINPDKLQHQLLLVDLWNSAIPSTPYAGIHSSNWLSLGFRGPNPIEDFKVTGILALRNLAYFAKHYLKPFQHILMTQTKREDFSSKSSLTINVQQQQESDITISVNIDENKTDEEKEQQKEQEQQQEQQLQSKSRSYPLAAACISLTYTLSNIFRIGRESSSDASLWDISFCDQNWFDECFITTVHLFESLWHSEAHSYSDFPQVISHSRSIIEKVCSDLPKSVQEFKDKLDSILEKKIPLDFEVSNDIISRYHQLQPSNTTKRHIHKIFGERIDIDIVPDNNQNNDDNCNNCNNNNEDENISDNVVENKRKKSSSLRVDIPNSNNNNSNEIGDGPISPTNFSYKRLIKFFGERVNSRSVQFAPQPSNVKSYKLKNFFGESAVIINQNDNNNNTNESQENQEEEEEEIQLPIIPMTERSHRLHVFFGEWFDTEQVEYNEKMRISISPEQTPPISPTLGNQPEHTRLHKLNKFFGERVNIPINKSRIIGESGGGSIFQIDDIEDSMNGGGVNNSESQPRSPEEARSDFKAQKLLGERLDIKKEKEALQFAPQPSHIREYKLHKLFGEMIPSSKQQLQQQQSQQSSIGSGPWKKGTYVKPSTSDKSSFYPQSQPQQSVTAPTSPRDNDSISPRDTSQSQPVSPNTNYPPILPITTTTTTSSYPVSISLPSSPRLSGLGGQQPQSTIEQNTNLNIASSELLVSPISSSPHQLQIHSGLLTENTFGGLKNSLDTNQPNSIRSSLMSDGGIQTILTSNQSQLEEEPFQSTITTQFGDIDETDQSNVASNSTTNNTNNNNNSNTLLDDEEEEEDHLKSSKNNISRDRKKSHRLHVFFGERFDVEEVGYQSRLSGSFSNSPVSHGNSPNLSTSLPIQPDTVKFFKLKKFFGKSPDTINNNSESELNNSGETNFNNKKSTEHRDTTEHTKPMRKGSAGSNNLKKSTYVDSTGKNLRRDFKPQKLLGERLDIKKEKDYMAFKDQPSTIKVDKLIGLFGEKVTFNLKRRESSPSLLNSQSKSSFNLKENPNLSNSITNSTSASFSSSPK